MARSKTVTLQNKIDRLEAKLADVQFDLSTATAAERGANAQLIVANGELEQLHTLLNQQHGAPPREYTVNGTLYTPNVTARLLAWLANK